MVSFEALAALFAVSGKTAKPQLQDHQKLFGKLCSSVVEVDVTKFPSGDEWIARQRWRKVLVAPTAEDFFGCSIVMNSSPFNMCAAARCKESIALTPGQTDETFLAELLR